MITVFTPTFNREKLIKRLYQSLCRQSLLDFEWVVVDDGSMDGTAEFFATLADASTPFPVRYFWQENGGKHRAVNKGVSVAKGELFFIVDSDDYLVPEAIRCITEWVESLSGDGLWAGVSGLRGYSVKESIGGFLDKEYIDADNLQRKRYGLLGDKAEVYYTDLLRKYPFIEYENEKFVTEAVVWDKIAHEGYKLRWFNRIIYICDYLDDGLTRSGNQKYLDSPKGTLYRARQILDYNPHDIKTRLKTIYKYYDIFKKYSSIREIAEQLYVKPATVCASIIIYSIYALRNKN